MIARCTVEPVARGLAPRPDNHAYNSQLAEAFVCLGYAHARREPIPSERLRLTYFTAD
jgi:hypothetical protein